MGFRFSSTLLVSGISTGTIDFIPQMVCANSQGICGFSYFTAEEAESREVMARWARAWIGSDTWAPPVGPGCVSDGGGRTRSRRQEGGLGGAGSAPALARCFLDRPDTWFERISMLVILLNCVTLGMFRPCEDIACDSQRCRILQVSVRVVWGGAAPERSNC